MKRTSGGRVEVYRRMLALRGAYLDETSKVLDFGCGSGAVVYAFRDAGFDAYGFDIHDCLELRSPQDRMHFQIANKGGDTSDSTLDWANYLLPYEDATFDFVLSSQVMEHIHNHDAVLRELARVTKPHGIGIHVFPPRCRVLEAHTFVPFGGMTKAHWYYRLWAMLGIRNEFQRGKTAKEVAASNSRYAHTGTNYPSHRTLRALGARYFERSYFAPQLWHIAYDALGWRLARPALRAYTLLESLVWVLDGPLALPKAREEPARPRDGHPGQVPAAR